MVSETAIFEALHLIGPGPVESVARDVGIAGHRLRLSNDTHLRAIKREIVIHVSAGHVEFRRLTDDECPRRDRP